MQNQPTFTEKYSAIIKMVMIGVLVILLLLPSYLVQQLIREREQNQDQVKREISSKWGAQQRLAGPVISIPYNHYITDNDSKTRRSTKQYIHLMPSTLKVKGTVDTSMLSRSIYKVIAYTSDLEIEGTFDGEELNTIADLPSNADWDNATINFGLSDLTGIQDEINLQVNEQTIKFNPGMDDRSLFHSGVSAPISISPEGKISFNFKLKLKGTESIEFLPVGKETRVSLHSACPNPNFYGTFLPADRDVTEKGFDAEWKVLHLNRNYPQAWAHNGHDIDYSAFGVELMLDVDPYQKTMRSAKYAILFIAMTFLTFFFIEVLSKKKIHPIQYILIGLVLILFYVLLLSISEQLGFNWGYFIGSSAVVLLITIYTASVLQSNKKSMVMFAILTTLYGFIFIIIQMAEYSLLFGSIGLFLFLAAVMLASRKVDWYNIGLKEKTE